MDNSSSSCAAAAGLHAVVVPYPLQGHVNPCLSIAKVLVPKGFTFTFVITEHVASKLPSWESHEHSQSSSIRFVSIPDGLPSSHPREGLGTSALASTLSIMHGMRAPFELLLPRLRASCLMADSFVTWSPLVARRFLLPWVALFTTNAHTLSVVLHSPHLLSSGVIPVQDPHRIIDSIPGVPPLRAGDLPQSVRTMPDFAVDQVTYMHEAAGLLLNTVYEIESETLDALKTGGVRVYPIGPLLLMPGSSVSDAGSLGFWPEERNCLNWLDTQPTSSVLYVSFGSIATMGAVQMKELAQGLEASRQPFLWVIRSNSADGSVSDVLPEGFLERTAHRGLIISWAPQVEVLSHASVGGFVTHCGWNSITENLSTGGLPMICWPHAAEQKLNAIVLVDEWKVGLELQEEEGVVKAGEVERVVKLLMQGEEGQELRDRALQLKETACSAVRDGGSSQRYLEAFVQDMGKKVASRHDN